MTFVPLVAPIFGDWARLVSRAMEVLWLLTVFLVPLTFIDPESMALGFIIPKVTLYRSLVGVICALWLIERALGSPIIGEAISRTQLGQIKGWLLSNPSRIIIVAAWAVLTTHLISTLLSSSITVSFWGKEPALDGNSFYNTLSHFILFLVVATHTQTKAQLWRLYGAVIASGLLVGSYAVLQFYGLDPLGIHSGGTGVVSSLGNPIFVGAFLLMVVPLTMTFALKSCGTTPSRMRTFWGIIALTILLLGMAFTIARGPWVGLAAALLVFLAIISISIGWRASLRAIMTFAAAFAVTWAIVTFMPVPSGTAAADPLPRAVSAGSAVVSTLSPDLPGVRPLSTAETDADLPDGINNTPVTLTSMETRLLVWEGSAQLALRRPGVQAGDWPVPVLLHLFGYGPEFFQYLFPLIRPQELGILNIGGVYYQWTAAHNGMLNRWVELGIFGLVSHLVLLGTAAVVGIRQIRDNRTTTYRNQKLAMAAVLASLAGRSVEQLVGIAHISDEALFWILLALVVSVAAVADTPSTRDEKSSEVRDSTRARLPKLSKIRWPVLQLSLALVIVSMLLGFTLVKNVGYVMAERTATTATVSLSDGELAMAMQSIERAIRLAPDVGRYHVTRANILDTIRRSRSDVFEQTKLALEAYRANERAVNANPFETYASFHLAESTLILAALGHPGKSAEAIENYQRLTIMLPRYWRSYSLLGRAYAEVGKPAYAVEAFNQAIGLDPMSPQLYDSRAEAYRLLGEHRLALADYNRAIKIAPSDPSRFARRGIAKFALGRLEEAVQDFDQAINRMDREIALLVQFGRLDEARSWDPELALVHNNRGSAHYQLGRIERAVDDYDRGIQLSPRSPELYANRSLAYGLLNRDADARRDMNLAIELGFDPALLRLD